MDIYNNLPPELQSIIQKKYERMLLHERLKEAQRYLSCFLLPRSKCIDTFINLTSSSIFETPITHFSFFSTVSIICHVEPEYNLNKVTVRIRNLAEKTSIVYTQLFNLRGYVEYFTSEKSNEYWFCQESGEIDFCIHQYLRMLHARYNEVDITLLRHRPFSRYIVEEVLREKVY